MGGGAWPFLPVRLPTRQVAICRPTWAGHGVKVSWLGRPRDYAAAPTFVWLRTTPIRTFRAQYQRSTGGLRQYGYAVPVPAIEILCACALPCGPVARFGADDQNDVTDPCGHGTWADERLLQTCKIRDPGVPERVAIVGILSRFFVRVGCFLEEPRMAEGPCCFRAMSHRSQKTLRTSSTTAAVSGSCRPTLAALPTELLELSHARHIRNSPQCWSKEGSSLRCDTRRSRHTFVPKRQM